MNTGWSPGNWNLAWLCLNGWNPKVYSLRPGLTCAIARIFVLGPQFRERWSRSLPRGYGGMVSPEKLRSCEIPSLALPMKHVFQTKSISVKCKISGILDFSTILLHIIVFNTIKSKDGIFHIYCKWPKTRCQNNNLISFWLYAEEYFAFTACFFWFTEHEEWKVDVFLAFSGPVVSSYNRVIGR